MSRLYHNLLPERYDAERQAARRVGAVPVEVPGAAFEALAAEAETMIYAVVGNRLLVSKRKFRDVHISHAVLASGEQVRAAGELRVGWQRDGMVVTALNNASGHYQPASGSLAVARAAFEARGLPVRPDAVRHYDWRAS